MLQASQAETNHPEPVRSSGRAVTQHNGCCNRSLDAMLRAKHGGEGGGRDGRGEVG